MTSKAAGICSGMAMRVSSNRWAPGRLRRPLSCVQRLVSGCSMGPAGVKWTVVRVGDPACGVALTAQPLDAMKAGPVVGATIALDLAQEAPEALLLRRHHG